MPKSLEFVISMERSERNDKGLVGTGEQERDGVRNFFIPICSALSISIKLCNHPTNSA